METRKQRKINVQHESNNLLTESNLCYERVSRYLRESKSEQETGR